MSKRNYLNWGLAVIVVIASVGPAFAQDALNLERVAQLRAERPADMAIANGGVVWQPKGAFAEASLTIAGNRGVVFQGTFAGGLATFNLMADDGSRLADGIYGYEVSFSPNAGEAKRMSGHIKVENGAAQLTGMDRILADPPSAPVNPPQDVFSHSGPIDIEGKLVVGHDSASVGSPGEIVIWADDGNPEMILPANLVFINENTGGTVTENRTIVSDSVGFRFGPQSAGIASPAVVTFEDGPANSLVVESSGDVGIGTLNPVENLTVFDSGDVDLRLHTTSTGAFADLEMDSADTSTEDEFQVEINGFEKLRIAASAPSSSLFISTDGMGIGTGAPEADFHLTNLDATGDTVFKIARAPAGSWNLGMTSAGVFTFNKGGTGGQEATFRDRNDAVATFDVQGHVRGTSFKSTSSRELKTGFEALDPSAVLAKVAEMPVTSWRYKTEEAGVKHFGPVAEDFQRLFGLGDGETIATVDADGVALAAIQGLNSELKAQVQAKDAQIEALEARLAVIEEKLTALSP